MLLVLLDQKAPPQNSCQHAAEEVRREHRHPTRLRERCDPPLVILVVHVREHQDGTRARYCGHGNAAVVVTATGRAAGICRDLTFAEPAVSRGARIVVVLLPAWGCEAFAFAAGRLGSSTRVTVRCVCSFWAQLLRSSSCCSASAHHTPRQVAATKEQAAMADKTSISHCSVAGHMGLGARQVRRKVPRSTSKKFRERESSSARHLKT
jgi:hypothetical protein